MFGEVCLSPEDLRIELYTQNEGDKIPEVTYMYNKTYYG